MLVSNLILLVGLGAGLGSAYHQIRLPKTMGYKMKTAALPPCGGFNFTGTMAGTNVSVNGYPYAVTSTKANVTFTVRVRLLKDPPEKMHQIMPPLVMSMYGTLCIPSISVSKEWAGELAEYHSISDHASMRTYQCALVQFVDTPAVDAASFDVCKNTTGVNGTFQAWGSPILTTPTPSASLPEPSNTQDVSGNTAVGASTHFNSWLSIGVPAMTSLIPFLIMVI